MLGVVRFAPVQAQNDGTSPVQMPAASEVNLNYFEQQLAPFGQWINHPQFGEVWKPDLGPDFRPYFNGYWQFTSDYGWLWVSNEPFGDVVYHYGRWVYDQSEGWLWVPGYVWGPGWVAWRDTGEYVGWLPLPPGYSDDTALSPLINSPQPAVPEALYGYQDAYGATLAGDAFASMWIFVPGRDFGRRDRRPYIVDRETVRNLYRRSKDSTHYEFDRDHDRIIDRSLDKDALERSARHSFGTPPAGDFMHSRVPMNTVTQGRRLSAVPVQGRRFDGPRDPSGVAGFERRDFPGRAAEPHHLASPAGSTATSLSIPPQTESPAQRMRPPRISAAPRSVPHAVTAGAPVPNAPNIPSTEFRAAARPAMPIFRGHVPVAAPLAAPGAIAVPPAVILPRAPVANAAAPAVHPPSPQLVPRARHLQ